MDPVVADTTSATDWEALDLSSVVTAGSSQVVVRFKNTSDVLIKVHYRKTGSSDDETTDVTPGDSSGNVTLALTTTRTIEAKIDGGGSLSCIVVDFGGSGVVTTTVTVADIRTLMLASGYNTSDISDASIQKHLDKITNEVTNAATRHANIAGYALETAIKTSAIEFGAAALTLMALRNKGASQGLQAQRIAVSSETVQDWWVKYSGMLEKIRSGIVY